eukprot:787954-Pyramimonas_sp.AAC.1
MDRASWGDPAATAGLRALSSCLRCAPAIVLGLWVRSAWDVRRDVVGALFVGSLEAVWMAVEAVLGSHLILFGVSWGFR